MCNAKWLTTDANVYHLVYDGPLSPATDIVAPATEAAFKKLKGSPQLKKFKRDDFAITLHDVRFVQRLYGEVMQVGVGARFPKMMTMRRSLNAPSPLVWPKGRMELRLC